MSVSEIESAGVTWDVAADFTGTKPAGIADGDLMTCVVLITDEARDVNTIPSGWTEQINVTTGNGRLVVYTKPVTNAAGEPASYTWSLDASATNEVYGSLTLWRGVDHDDPFKTSAWRATGATSSHTSAELAVEIVDGEYAGWYFVATGTANTFTPPAGLTEQFDGYANLASGIGHEIATLTLTDEGQTGWKVASSSQSGVSVTFAAIMRPESPIDAPIRVSGTDRVDLGAAGTDLAVPRPTVKPGQLMLAVLGTRTTISGSGEIATVPDGWELVLSKFATSTGESQPTLILSVYAKTAGLEEPKSYTWTTEGDSQSSGVIAVFDGASHVDVSNSAGTLLSKVTNQAIPDITPTKRHTLMVHAWYVENTPTLPANTNQQSGGAGAEELYVSTCHRAPATAPVTNSFVATFSSSISASAAVALAPRIPVPRSLQEAA